jgi:hypothetical protein
MVDSYKTHYRIASVTSTTTRTCLRELVNAVYTSKSLTAPPGTVFKVRLTPSAAIEVSDAYIQDPVSISAMTEFEIDNALNNLYLKNAATVAVEMHYGE